VSSLFLCSTSTRAKEIPDQFCNLWLKELDATGDEVKYFSYIKAVELGYFTTDPAQYNNPKV
jgi:hypothetical protein